jgi:hypothetical protein
MFAACITAAATHDTRDAEARATGNPVMLAFARAIRGLDAALATRDSQALLTHATALRAAVLDTTRLAPQKNAELLPLFQEYRARIGTLSSELAEKARRQDFASASEDLRRIRQTCITCHETFRGEMDPPTDFPRDGNVVSGSVRILSQEGKVIPDRSNVVVFLDGVKPAAPDIPPGRYAISQKDHAFVPRVLPVVKGSIVAFPNDDIIFHNAFSLSQARPFDLDIYQPGESREVVFPVSGLVKVYCNIHPHMVANILVLENPYFCVTNNRGIFVISGVPDGTYWLRTWHEFGKETSSRIEVAGGVLHRFDLDVQETVCSIAHTNKFGHPYGSNY